MSCRLLQDLPALVVVEAGLPGRAVLGRDLAAEGVELGGEVPAAGVGLAVVAVAGDAVAQRGDLLRVGRGPRPTSSAACPGRGRPA